MVSEKLAEAVREYRCLWDVSKSAYKDRMKKGNAWKEVASKVGDGVTPSECAVRWKAMRDKFVRELKKVKGGKSGDPGPPYSPSWPLFDVLCFLTDTVKHRKSHTNLPASEVDDTAGDGNIQVDLESEETELEERTPPSNSQEMDENGPEGSGSVDSLTVEPVKLTTAAKVAKCERSGASSTPQPPAKGRKGSRSEVLDELLIREIVRMDKRRAEREERREQRIEMRSALDEDDIFGQQVAAIFKRLNRAQKSRARIHILQLLENIEFPPAVGDPLAAHEYTSGQYDY